ncbi:MAG: hypothetical protein AAF380_03275, partial [Bacteroidota bacterium]
KKNIIFYKLTISFVFFICLFTRITRAAVDPDQVDKPKKKYRQYPPQKGTLVFKSGSSTLKSQPNRKNLKPVHAFDTYHVSCKSYMPEKWEGKEDIGGIVLYSYDGKYDWYLNGIHCKSGYIVLKKSADIDHLYSEEGVIHGKVYKSLFNEELDTKKVLGGGFAYYKGVWKFNSWTLNSPSNDDMYHDKYKCMNKDEEEIIKAALKKWIATGTQNYKVKEKVLLFCDTSKIASNQSDSPSYGIKIGFNAPKSK